MATRIDIDSDSFGITTIDNKGGEIYVPRGKSFEIVGISTDTDTDEIYYEIECTRLGLKSNFQIPKSDATDVRRLGAYRKYGLDVTDSNKSLVPEVFQQLEDEYVDQQKSIEKVHSLVGVKHCVDKQKKDIYVFAGHMNPVTGSVYRGPFDLEPKGDRDVWFGMVEEILSNNPQIMFIISIPFAAILHGVLKDVVDLENIIIHLRGDSSSGKSTMLCLAISAIGSPSENSPNGLISSWNGTRNAIIRRLMGEGKDGVRGMLFGLDEFSMNGEKNLSALIYSIASGIEKERLTREAKMQDRLVGKYLVLSTGEASILNKTNGNIGLSMRVLEMDDCMWTNSAEQSERIKRVVKANYGFAGEEFGLKLGKWIQKHGMEALLERFDVWRRFYMDRCTIQERKERMSSRYGLILLAADFTKEFFGFEMDEEAIVDLLISNENANAEDRNDYAGFYHKLVSVIVANGEHFDRPDRSIKLINGKMATVPSLKECWGTIFDVKETIRLAYDGETYAQKIVYIALHYFDDIAKRQLGYEDTKALRKWLKKRGFSKCEEGHAYIRKTIKGIKGKYVAVYLPGEQDQGKIAAKQKIKDLLVKSKKLNQGRLLNHTRSEEEVKVLLEYIEKLKELEDCMDDGEKKQLASLVKYTKKVNKT